jgi:hypothetical protein
MAGHTLRKMAQGGIHDHVGGGYHRYAVDDAWFVPHFEKMLYDQAQIALNALEMKQASGDERYAWMARDIFDYVAEQLTGPHGGFYSAEDADSTVPGATAGEHAEGAFYVWSHAELTAALGADAEFFDQHFGVKPEGNVPAELDPQGEFTGKNILQQVRPLAESARAAGLTTEQASERLRAGLAKLKAVRAGRPRPLRDDKVITAWNGLMISALAKGHQVLGDDAVYLTAAVKAAEFVERELYDAERGVLYRSWREGRAASAGFAEDYACFIQGLLDLYEASFDGRWLRWAVRLQATMDERFADTVHGGYFNSAADAADIVVRLKEDYDGAEPAPSSVAAMNLLRLEALTGGEAPGGYRGRAMGTLGALRMQWTRVPQGLPQLLCALELAFLPPRHVVIAGEPATAEFQALAAVVHERLGPRRAVVRAEAALAWTAPMVTTDGRATAYLCEDFACRLPVTTPADLRTLLGAPN